MSAWGGAVDGVDKVRAQLMRERDEVDSRAQQQTMAAAQQAAAVLRRAAVARTGTVRTTVTSTGSGATVSAVSNIPLNRARVNAAVQAGSRQLGGAS